MRILPLLSLSLLLAAPVLAQSLTINADTQEANSVTGIVQAKGNVRLEYSARQLTARAKLATYDEKKALITLTGEVVVDERGRNRLQADRITYDLNQNHLRAEPTPGEQVTGTYQIAEKSSASIKADLQEADPGMGLVTASGNIRFEYPARQIIATAQKAVFRDKERTIVLEGNVSVLQQGTNSIQAESVTYAIDQSRFIASPTEGKQVRATYSLPSKSKVAPLP